MRVQGFAGGRASSPDTGTGAFARLAVRCRELTDCIERGDEWYPLFLRAASEPLDTLTELEQSVVQSVLLSLFFQGAARQRGTELGLPKAALLLSNRALRLALSYVTPARRPDTGGQTHVTEALQHLHHRYSDPELRLADLARQSQLSKWHFDRLLKLGTGAGFRDHLRAIRLMKARELLEASALEIKEIALSVGYKDISQFSRHFKQHFGITATSYRRQQRLAPPPDSE